MPAAGRSLRTFASARVDEGQRHLAHFIKLRLSSSGHPGARLLDDSEDDVFLGPSLFAFFSEPDPALTLDQVLYGTLPAEHRPAEIEAYADRHGIIDLPGLGHLAGDLRDQAVTVAPAELAIRAEGSARNVVFVEEPRVAGTDIACASRPGPLFEPICRKACHGSSIRGAEGDGSDLLESISRALEIIQALDAELHRCLLAVTRQIICFRAEDGGSFATLAAHGAVFLCTPSHSDEVFFIEDLIHQCGHLLINTLTLDRDELIAIDPNTPLRKLADDPSEERSLYVALHGVFTECLMSLVLAEALDGEQKFFNRRQAHELRGRLSLIMKRLQLDLARIRDLDVFTREGRRLVASFEEVFDGVYAAAGNAITGCDLRNQPYAFSYERFAELNPV